MNLKTIILLCVIVLFVPACVLAEHQFSQKFNHQRQHVESSSFNNKNRLNDYKIKLQNKFESIAQQKEQLEQELLKLSAMEDRLFNPFKLQHQQMSDAEGINKCSACQFGVKKVVKTFGCGSFLISYKSCLPLIETVVGAVVCAALVYTAKATIQKSCEKTTDINKVASTVSNYICKKKTQLCQATTEMS